MSAAIQLKAIPRRRGVAKYRGKVMGANAYFAVTSERELLHGSVYVATAEMPDEALVTWLRDELDRHDPPRPKLKIEPRTVTASMDGPSKTHPEILARVEMARRAEELTTGDVAELIESYPEDSIMRGVCERLSRLLEKPA
jgi:hypothetical protein